MLNFRTIPILLLLSAAAPVVAQEDADGEIIETIPSNTVLEKSFSLNNAVDCRRGTYRFSLTSDSDIVTLPESTVELSSSERTGVQVRFDSNGVETGRHSANITVSCVNCGLCRADDKVLRVVLTVTEPESIPDADEAPAEDVADTEYPEIVLSIVEVAVPDVTGMSLADANEQLVLRGLRPVPAGDGVLRGDLVSILEQRPAAGETVDSGTDLTAVLGVPVPDLSGMTAAEARTQLGEFGLALAPAASGAVAVGQIPAVGAVAVIGSTVSLVFPAAVEPSAYGEWLMVLAALLVAAAAFFLWWKAARAPAVPAAAIEVRSTLDPGSQEISSEGELRRSIVRVRLAGDPAIVSVQGNPAAITEKEWK